MLGVLFPGQGSQEVGMGRDVYEASAAARAVFDAADRVLGFGLAKLCFEGPEAELRRTELQQPAILTTSVALLRALEERVALAPVCLAGHSLGEYTALVASGALERRERGRAWCTPAAASCRKRCPRAAARWRRSSAPPRASSPGSCAVAARETGRVVEPANWNSPLQTVIAGDADAVERACAEARERGAKKAVPLAVSAPFHCSLMAPAAEKLARRAGAACASRAPRVAGRHNVEADAESRPGAHSRAAARGR